MRVALEKAPVHVSAGVALVTVADHILGLMTVAAGPGELPLPPGRETGATPATKPRCLYLLDDPLGVGLGRCTFLQGGVAVAFDSS